MVVMIASCGLNLVRFTIFELVANDALPRTAPLGTHISRSHTSRSTPKSMAERIWKDLSSKYPDLAARSGMHQFEGDDHETPSMDIIGVLMMMPLMDSPVAKMMREAQAKLMARFMGGDETLVDEIRGIARFHREGKVKASDVLDVLSKLAYDYVNNARAKK